MTRLVPVVFMVITLAAILIYFGMSQRITIQIALDKPVGTPAPSLTPGPTATPVTINQPIQPAPIDCDIDGVNNIIQNLPATNLPDLIVALLPTNGIDNISWDYLVDSPLISWQTDGINFPTQGNDCRQGLVRVRVNGTESRILRQKWEELAWTVSMETSGNPNFGPKLIEIFPGGADSKSGCFGIAFSGCTFTAVQALASPLIQSKLLCSPAQPGEQTDVYSVTASGKEPDLVVYQANLGSGGESDLLQIRPLSDASQMCNSSQ